MKENNTTNNYRIRALITIEVEQWPFCYTVFITQFFQKNPPPPWSSPNPWSPVKTLLLAHGPNYLSVCLWLPLRAAVSRAQVLCGPKLLTDTHPLPPPPSVCVLSHSSLHSRSPGRHRVLSLTLRCFAVVLTPLHYLTPLRPSPCLLRLLFRFIRAEETQF